MGSTLERLTNALGRSYRVERELGAGGMATVYLAEDLKHKRKVAIKVLRDELAAAVGPERFLREIETTANLRHPHILPLYDSGEAGGLLYYVMPLIEGESLRDRLSRDKSLPIEDALQITREVADALGYAHTRGIIHRDIKPENVLLEGGHAVVADFGIAKAVSALEGGHLTQAGLAVGTPAYMSPEQVLADKDLDGRSDLYSLGCVLYEMLTGEAPFAADSPQRTIARRLTEPPPVAQARRPEIGAHLSGVVQRVLATDAVNRPATAAEFSRALAASPTPVPSDLAAGTSRSIAVLPFANMSADPADEFFADGITEEIINALAQLPGLSVAARTSAFAFKGRHEDLRAVGEKLGVTSVLEGSVRKAGTRLRITAQLIKVADGYHLWSERYDREMTDVFAVQDEIAGAIASKLKVTIEGAEPAARVRPSTSNLEAYQLLLKGRVLHAQRGPAISRAKEAFEQALLLDPALAEAHALLGDAFRLFAIYGMAPTSEVIPKARAAAERALALDPDQVEALATLSSLAAIFDWNWAACNALAGRALAIDPRHVRVMVERAFVATYRRGATPTDHALALAQFDAAVRMDPLNAWAAGVHSFGLASVGRHAESVAEARRAIELDPASFTGRWALVWALGAAGRDADVLEAAEPALLMSGRGSRILADAAAAHARLGHREAAEDIFREITTRAKNGYVGWSEQGAIAASAGRLEEARALVARGIEARESFLAFLTSPAWGPFQADAGCRAMLEEVGP